MAGHAEGDIVPDLRAVYGRGIEVFCGCWAATQGFAESAHHIVLGLGDAVGTTHRQPRQLGAAGPSGLSADRVAGKRLGEKAGVRSLVVVNGGAQSRGLTPVKVRSLL